MLSTLQYRSSGLWAMLTETMLQQYNQVPQVEVKAKYEPVKK